MRNNKLKVKFFRQYSLDGYILDFYCPEKRIAIEIDGGYHQQSSSKIYDEYREKYISAFNIKVIRFNNEEVVNNKKVALTKNSALLLV